VILGAFIAGAILRLVDADAEHKHPLFHQKLDAIGYGFLIPVFLVTSGLTFNLSVLFSSASTLLRVPLFLLALLVVPHSSAQGFSASSFSPSSRCSCCDHLLKVRARSQSGRTFEAA
jgi:Kef-type K+ transport system membrane component KefB